MRGEVHVIDTKADLRRKFEEAEMLVDRCGIFLSFGLRLAVARSCYCISSVA